MKGRRSGDRRGEQRPDPRGPEALGFGHWQPWDRFKLKGAGSDLPLREPSACFGAGLEA